MTKQKAKKQAPLNGEFRSKLLMKMILDKRTKEDIALSLAGKQIGVTKSTAQRIEATGMTDVKTLPKVCNWLGVSVTMFY